MPSKERRERTPSRPQLRRGIRRVVSGNPYGIRGFNELMQTTLNDLNDHQEPSSSGIVSTPSPKTSMPRCLYSQNLDTQSTQSEGQIQIAVESPQVNNDEDSEDELEEMEQEERENSKISSARNKVTAKEPMPDFLMSQILDLQTAGSQSQNNATPLQPNNKQQSQMSNIAAVVNENWHDSEILVDSQPEQQISKNPSPQINNGEKSQKEPLPFPLQSQILDTQPTQSERHEGKHKSPEKQQRTPSSVNLENVLNGKSPDLFHSLDNSLNSSSSEKSDDLLAQIEAEDSEEIIDIEGMSQASSEDSFLSALEDNNQNHDHPNCRKRGKNGESSASSLSGIIEHEFPDSSDESRRGNKSELFILAEEDADAEPLKTLQFCDITNEMGFNLKCTIKNMYCVLWAQEEDMGCLYVTDGTLPSFMVDYPFEEMVSQSQTQSIPEHIPIKVLNYSSFTAFLKPTIEMEILLTDIRRELVQSGKYILMLDGLQYATLPSEDEDSGKTQIIPISVGHKRPRKSTPKKMIAIAENTPSTDNATSSLAAIKKERLSCNSSGSIPQSNNTQCRHSPGERVVGSILPLEDPGDTQPIPRRCTDTANLLPNPRVKTNQNKNPGGDSGSKALSLFGIRDCYVRLELLEIMYDSMNDDENIPPLQDEIQQPVHQLACVDDDKDGNINIVANGLNDT